MQKKLAGIILSVMLLLVLQSASAQTYIESALTFSRTKPGGSARVQGLGSAQVALGGDYSSALSNPAGLGMYNRSEYTFSPAFTTLNVKSSYLGSQDSEQKTKLNIPGFSLVFNFPKETGSFLGGSLGISFTRINDFNGITRYGATNPNSSIIDYFVDDSNGYDESQFDGYQYNRPTGLAYQNYLIGLSGPNTYSKTVKKAIPDQLEQIETSGAQNQWSISYGANFDDKVFLGAGLGISTLKYKSVKNYSETFSTDTLNYMGLTEELSLRGSGINATFGAIFRPVDHLQIGISLTTPTFYQITETYSANMNTEWNNFDYFDDGTLILNDRSWETDIVTTDYNLTTPLKFSTGIAYITKIGFLTADLELTNPGKAKYSSNTGDFNFGEDNDAIRSTYKNTVNLRFGGEARYNIFRFRAGYGIQGNTYQSNFNDDNKITSISLGAGIKTKSFFFDVAWIQSKMNSVYFPYYFTNLDIPDPVVDLKTKMTNIMLTLGFTF